MIDLDNFKYYNDTQGHSAGDDLIVRIAQALTNRPARDRRARASRRRRVRRAAPARGPRRAPKQSPTALLEVVRDEAPAPIHGRASGAVTASIGIACFSDGDRLMREEIMVNADLAMYDAKENGRNRRRHYGTEEHERPRIESQMKWASEITHALAEDRFELLAQPIKSLARQRPDPVRAAAAHARRPRRPDPPRHLPLHRRAARADPGDRSLGRRARDRHARRAPRRGHDLRFEVNLSGHSIGDPELLELIERRLQETGVPPDRLIFEITETAAVVQHRPRRARSPTVSPTSAAGSRSTTSAPGSAPSTTSSTSRSTTSRSTASSSATAPPTRPTGS